MITPIRIAYLAGPNASVTVRLRHNTVIRMMLANGFEHTFEPPLREFVMNGMSLSPNGELAIFPIEAWEMDFEQSVLLDCFWETGLNVMEMAWKAVIESKEGLTPDDIGDGFAGAVIEMMAKAKPPTPDLKECQDHAIASVVQRFVRRQKFRGRA